MNIEQKELLELAAKACDCATHVTDETYRAWQKFNQWNPLEDDGDCARMEAQLLMTINLGPLSVFVQLSTQGAYIERVEDFCAHNGDRNAARRMASTRVAAEIGRRMK